MSISFNSFPSYRRASMVAVEMEGKRRSAGGSYIPEICLIVGMYLAAKSPVDNVPVRVYTADEVADIAGLGSEAHRQALKVFGALGGFSENVWYVPIPAPTSGTPAAASGTITFTGTASTAGTFYFNIGGEVYEIPVAKNDTDDDVAAALVAAITADVDAAVSAAAGSGEDANIVTITCKWVGVNGNEICVASNPDGTLQSNLNPAGIAVTLPETGLLTLGAGTPSVEDAFFDANGADILGDRWYTILTAPYNDDANLELYNDLGELRAAPDSKRFLAAFPAYVQKTYSEAMALPATVNSKWLCPVWEDRSLSPSWELGAAVAGLVMASAINDPGRPFKNQELDISVNTASANRTYAQNDALFRAGMGYCKISAAGNLILGDLPTTYRTTLAGAATEEWFDAVTITRRQAKVYSIDQLFLSPPYDRAILGSDDLVTGKSYVIKPKSIIADLFNLVDWWAQQGWTKNPDTVKASIAAEINGDNNSRLDATLTDDEAQALRIIAMKYAYLY